MSQLHVRTSKKPEPLTKEQREIVYGKPTANAGEGWDARWSDRQGNPLRDADEEPRRHR